METLIAKGLPTMPSHDPPGPAGPVAPAGAGQPEALLAQVRDSDLVVDLGGLDAVAALARVAAVLAEGAADGRERVWFRFPRADGSGAATLFQPVGRALQAAIREGRVVRAMPGQDGGWIARLPGPDRT